MKGSVAGLFAGIGGMELGFKLAGFPTGLLCEIEPAAMAVLRQRFPGVRVHGDVRELKELPSKTAIVCAGFPCQDLSSVGQKQGIKGDNSGLVAEVFRLLERRPADWIVIENVPFMLRLDAGRAIRDIVARLEELQYDWAYRVVDSQSFGLPHRRKRVFLIASRVCDPRPVLFPQRDPSISHELRPSWDSADAIGFYWTEGMYATGLAFNALPPLKGGSTIGIPSPPAALLRNGHVVTPHINDAERLQGFPAAWTLPATRVARESIRWRLVGNAVTVRAARWIARNLAYQMERSVRAEWLENSPIMTAGSWPDSAWGSGGRRFSVDTSHYPVAREMVSLTDFLKFPPKPLSSKATNGFLDRFERGNLFLPDGFVEKLRHHARTTALVSA